MFEKKTLSLSIAMAATLGAYALPSFAQEDEMLKEIVVSGIKASLAEAIDVKRNNTQIVDAIVAEDVGKFPDNNVVEALQRVTGVQITNPSSGEYSQISIRGLTDVNTTVNGRQIFTASGLAVALQDIPASLIKEVDIYKTRSASQIENGIAGSVDIKTQRPFDFADAKFVLAARAINQDQSDKTDPTISGLASDRWQTSAGEFGALVNLSYARTNYRDQTVSAGAMMPFSTDKPGLTYTNYQPIAQRDQSNNIVWQAGQLNGLSTAAGSTLPSNGQQIDYMLGRDGVSAIDFSGERERTAANISLQYAPNDSSEYLLEVFYNGYRNDTYQSLLYAYTDWWGEYANDPAAANVVLHNGSNVVKSRSVKYPYVFTSGDLTSGQTDSYVYALGGNWDLSDNLYVESELVYQKSEFSSDFFAMRFDRVAYGMDVAFNAGSGLTAFNFLDNAATADVNEADLADLSAWKTNALYDNANRMEGDSLSFTTDATLTTDLGIFNEFQSGIRIDQRTAAEAYSAQSGVNTGIALQDMAGLAYINSGFFDGESKVPTTWAAANGYYIRDHASEIRTLYNLSKQNLVQTFDIEELTSSAYITGKFATTLADKKLDGELGVRYTNTQTDMSFFDSATGDGSTSKALPSLLLRYHLSDSLVTRVAYTETLRRPDFSDYSNIITYGNFNVASSGNEKLQPTESQNYDLSLEWYFSDSSSLYGTLFQRDIDGLVVVVPHALTNSTYVLYQPDNAASGQLQGAELGAVWFPKNLPGFLDGFGVQASYTLLDSEQSTPLYDATGGLTGYQDTSMFGVSDNSYSLVLAYEKNQVGVRLSYAWRSEFLSHYGATYGANPLEVWKKPEISLGLQISYDVNEWLSLTLDGTNLTNEIYQTYYGSNATTNNLDSVLHSRTLALGARLTF